MKSRILWQNAAGNFLIQMKETEASLELQGKSTRRIPNALFCGWPLLDAATGVQVAPLVALIRAFSGFFSISSKGFVAAQDYNR